MTKRQPHQKDRNEQKHRGQHINTLTTRGLQKIQQMKIKHFKRFFEDFYNQLLQRQHALADVIAAVQAADPEKKTDQAEKIAQIITEWSAKTSKDFQDGNHLHRNQLYFQQIALEYIERVKKHIPSDTKETIVKDDKYAELSLAYIAISNLFNHLVSPNMKELINNSEQEDYKILPLNSNDAPLLTLEATRDKLKDCCKFVVQKAKNVIDCLTRQSRKSILLYHHYIDGRHPNEDIDSIQFSLHEKISRLTQFFSLYEQLFIESFVPLSKQFDPAKHEMFCTFIATLAELCVHARLIQTMGDMHVQPKKFMQVVWEQAATILRKKDELRKQHLPNAARATEILYEQNIQHLQAVLNLKTEPDNTFLEQMHATFPYVAEKKSIAVTGINCSKQRDVLTAFIRKADAFLKPCIKPDNKSKTVISDNKSRSKTLPSDSVSDQKAIKSEDEIKALLVQHKAICRQLNLIPNRNQTLKALGNIHQNFEARGNELRARLKEINKYRKASRKAREEREKFEREISAQAIARQRKYEQYCKQTTTQNKTYRPAKTDDIDRAIQRKMCERFPQMTPVVNNDDDALTLHRAILYRLSAQITKARPLTPAKQLYPYNDKLVAYFLRNPQSRVLLKSCEPFFHSLRLTLTQIALGPKDSVLSEKFKLNLNRYKKVTKLFEDIYQSGAKNHQHLKPMSAIARAVICGFETTIALRQAKKKYFKRYFPILDTVAKNLSTLNTLRNETVLNRDQINDCYHLRRQLLQIQAEIKAKLTKQISTLCARELKEHYNKETLLSPKHADTFRKLHRKKSAWLLCKQYIERFNDLPPAETFYSEEKSKKAGQPRVSSEHTIPAHTCNESTDGDYKIANIRAKHQPVKSTMVNLGRTGTKSNAWAQQLSWLAFQGKNHDDLAIRLHNFQSLVTEFKENHPNHPIIIQLSDIITAYSSYLPHDKHLPLSKQCLFSGKNVVNAAQYCLTGPILEKEVRLLTQLSSYLNLVTMPIIGPRAKHVKQQLEDVKKLQSIFKQAANALDKKPSPLPGIKIKSVIIYGGFLREVLFGMRTPEKFKRDIDFWIELKVDNTDAHHASTYLGKFMTFMSSRLPDAFANTGCIENQGSVAQWRSKNETDNATDVDITAKIGLPVSVFKQQVFYNVLTDQLSDTLAPLSAGLTFATENEMYNFSPSRMAWVLKVSLQAMNTPEFVFSPEHRSYLRVVILCQGGHHLAKAKKILFNKTPKNTHAYYKKKLAVLPSILSIEQQSTPESKKVRKPAAMLAIG